MNKQLGRLLILVASLVTLWVTAGVSYAIPTFNYDLVGTQTQTGEWIYTLTLTNTSGSVADAGAGIQDFLFDFDDDVTLLSVALPGGWDSSFLTSVDDYDFLMAWSLDPNSDIMPGTSLQFSFLFNDQLTEWSIDPTFSSVPEPSCMVLLGTGLAGLAGLRFRRKYSA